MVKYQLRWRGIDDERILKAFLNVPRHWFVSENLQDKAYGDHPLPIGEGQTISQPYIVALMTQALELHREDRVLEIGTGSGYQTAILAKLAGEVFTVERIEPLLIEAQQRLASLGYTNIRFHLGDGTLGWEEEAPYDKIIGTGGAPRIPVTLISQLGDPGRLIIPVGGRVTQYLILVRKKEGKVERSRLAPCSFIPLIGEEGW